MRPQHRKILLLAVLVICAGLVIFDRRSDGNGNGENIVGATPRRFERGSTREPTPGATQGQSGLSALLARDAYQSSAENLFSVATPAAQAKLAAAPPVQPIQDSASAAPPLPFTVIGKQRNGQSWQVFLARPDQTFVVHEGDMLTNTYQVVTIAPPAMQLRYLPLNQIQTLMIGSSFDE